MACPTCDHTMELINNVAAYQIFVCPRCGTVKTVTYTGIPEREIKVYVPKLVERCREFEKDRAIWECASRDSWFQLGIAESINTPAERT